MNNLSAFLERFKKLLSLEGVSERAVIVVIAEQCNVELEKKNIRIKNGVVYIEASSTAKNVIFRKKSKIVEALRDRTGSVVRDIR